MDQLHKQLGAREDHAEEADLVRCDARRVAPSRARLDHAAAVRAGPHAVVDDGACEKTNAIYLVKTFFYHQNFKFMKLNRRIHTNQ